MISQIRYIDGMHRRRFLAGLTGFIAAAPALVRAESLMALSPVPELSGLVIHASGLNDLSYDGLHLSPHGAVQVARNIARIVTEMERGGANVFSRFVSRDPGGAFRIDEAAITGEWRRIYRERLAPAS